MHPLCWQIVHQLGDGKFHSGTQLAKQFNCSRTNVWKLIQQLEKNSIPVQSVRGKGYRLENPIEKLDKSVIRQHLDKTALSDIKQIHILDEIDSTNAYLQRIADSGNHICLAESQSIGRGRLGRVWESPPGANIYLSLRWQFKLLPSELSGLSLVCGIATAKALTACGVNGIQLKWPNDLLIGYRKLGGILVEISGDINSPCRAIIGIGINVELSNKIKEKIDQPVTDLKASNAQLPSRNRIVSALINELILNLHRFEQPDSSSWQQDWAKFDALLGKKVHIDKYLLSESSRYKGGTINGIVKGINADGALIVKCGNLLSVFNSGEVSLDISELQPVNQH